MKENTNNIITEQEEQLMLNNDCYNDVTFQIPTNFGEIHRLTSGDTRMVLTANASSTDNTVVSVNSNKLQNNCWQIGSTLDDFCNSMMNVSLSLQDILATPGTKQVVMRLYQESSYLAESGIAVDIYKVDSSEPGNTDTNSSNIVATVYAQHGNGHYYDFDITNAINLYGENADFIVKMRLPDCVCSESSENCNCDNCTCCSCNASNALFISSALQKTAKPMQNSTIRLPTARFSFCS